MVDFLNNLKGIITEKAEVIAKKTEEVAADVVKKTEQTIDVQKIKNQIRIMERNNERDLIDIGKMIYEEFKKNGSIDERFQELCEAIQEREGAVEEMNKEIATLKGLDVCPACKGHLDPNAVYCPKCGVKIEKEDLDVVADVEATEQVVDEVEFEEE